MTGLDAGGGAGGSRTRVGRVTSPQSQPTSPATPPKTVNSTAKTQAGNATANVKPGSVVDGGTGMANTPTNSVTHQGSSRSVINTNNIVKSSRDWLGGDVRSIINQSGDRIFISADGLRKIRFDINNPSPHNNPHAHFEHFVNGRWRPVGPSSLQVFPFDVPQH